ncbi:hypothetical protein [Rhodanobacter sp. UC4436_H3]
MTSFLQLLMLPWMAWSQRMRRIIARTLLVILCLAIAGYVLLRRSAGAGPGLAHGLAVIDCLFWAAVVPRALVLANEARRLRLPALERAAAISTVLYAALTIALPAAVVAMLGGSGVVALAELALGASVGMGYATLPPWLGVWACLAPLLDDHLGAWLPMPVSDPVGFLHWVAPVAAVLWTTIALCWRRAARCDDEASRWLKPLALRWRALSAQGRNGAKLETELLRRRSSRMQPGVDLRRVGPDYLVRGLRVALGGWGVPQTVASRLRQAGLVLLNVLFAFALLATLRHVSNDQPHAIAYTVVLSMFASTPVIAFALSLFGAVLGPVSADALRARWSRDNAELAVLALLPGLGDAAHAKRALLKASVVPTLLAQAALLAGMLGVALWAHLPGGNAALLLLAQGGGMLATFALSVAALGGTAWHRGWQSLLIIAAIVLMLTTTGAALFRFGDNLLAQRLALSPIFLALWIALLAILLAIGRRGWRAFWCQPHPFLPHG